MTKTCSRCGVEREISRFSTYDNGHGPKVRSICKDCKNERSRGKRASQSKKYYEGNKENLSIKKKDYYSKNKDRLQQYSKDWYNSNRDSASIKRRARAYNITEEEVLDLLSRGCEVCGSDGTDTQKGLHIDHCHATNRVRGCLCHFCNIALGNLKDDKALVIKLGEYLDKYQ